MRFAGTLAAVVVLSVSFITAGQNPTASIQREPQGQALTQLLDEYRATQRAYESAIVDAWGVVAQEKTVERLAMLRTQLVALEKQLEMHHAQMNAPRNAPATVLSSTKPVSVIFRNAAARDILQFLARMSDVEVRFDGVDAATPLSFELVDAPAGAVFEYVINVAQLTAVRVDERTILVQPRR